MSPRSPGADARRARLAFSQWTRTPLGKSEMTLQVEEFDELTAIKMRCTVSGYYSRWMLTEAQGGTFVSRSSH